jgi:cytochrome c oxidase subunit 4
MSTRPLVTSRAYLMIWLSLVVLTGMTITIAGMHLGRWSALAAVLIAGTKGTLVLLYFMHLKYESRLFRIGLLVALATMTIILLLTFADTAYRG